MSTQTTCMHHVHCAAMAVALLQCPQKMCVCIYTHTKECAFNGWHSDPRNVTSIVTAQTHSMLECIKCSRMHVQWYLESYRELLRIIIQAIIGQTFKGKKNFCLNSVDYTTPYSAWQCMEQET